MLLSFNNYQERKDADGKSFLDIECMLFTAEPKMTRIQISIPSSADFDLTIPVQRHQPPTILFYDQTDSGDKNAVPDQPLNIPSLYLQDLFTQIFKVFYNHSNDQ